MDSDAQEMSDDNGNAGEVLEATGMPESDGSEINESHESSGQSSNDPLYVQKRLKQQKRAHEREIRDLHARMAELQSRMVQPEAKNDAGNSYAGESGVSEQIHQAVSYALQQKDMAERKAREAEAKAHVERQYQELHKHLDDTSDKYDDFDDVVRGHDAPFTPHMRDAALMLPKKGPGSAGEVLYHLGKNRDELNRIRNLHPLDQAAEMVKLSHGLTGMGSSAPKGSRPLGQIKNNPVTNSAGVNEKTPPSSIRALMKAGKFK